MECKKCSGIMKPSKALAQTFVGGMPDFIGDKHSSTFSAGGTGKLIDCLKCEECGWSVTASMQNKIQALLDKHKIALTRAAESTDTFENLSGPLAARLASEAIIEEVIRDLEALIIQCETE